MDRRPSSKATSTSRADRLGNGPYINCVGIAMQTKMGTGTSFLIGISEPVPIYHVGSAPRADRNGHTVERIKSYGI